MLIVNQHYEGTDMNQEQLKDFLKNPNKEQFDTVANEIINGFQICKGDIRYSFAEVEFYYYGEDQQDRHTYIRKCHAMDWFFHYSGVDIAFETKQEGSELLQFGGILIRSIIKHEVGKKDEIVAGPLRCQQEIFNGCKEIPTIEVKPERSNHEIGKNLRYGITDDEYEYRYFIIDEDFEWNCRTTRAVYDKKEGWRVKEKPVNLSYTAKPSIGKLE